MAQASRESSTLEVTVERFVAGGLGLAREADGRVVLVDGGLPGDVAVVEVESAKKSLVKAKVSSIVEASPSRIEPPCPEVAKGCGGCDLQHAASSDQVGLKVGIVTDALRRIAKLDDVEVRAGPELPSFAYRTSLRCGVDRKSGRLGFRRRRSNEIHVVQDCMIAHPLAAEIIRTGLFPGATEVVVRVGEGTGERLVVVHTDIGSGSDGSGPETPVADPWVVPEDVQVYAVPTKSSPTASGPTASGPTVGEPEVGGRTSGGDALSPGVHYHELVAGRRFRISANSFFQGRPDGAEVLTDAVRRALGDFDPAVDSLVDMYGGVGLFTGALGARNAELVEISRSATDDAKVNLADLGTLVTRSAVEDWKPRPADAVVADPARAGLDVRGVRAVAATGATQVALVSCDPASMARDVRLLSDAGYELVWVEVIDMFPQTHHVETVASMRRRA